MGTAVVTTAADARAARTRITVSVFVAVALGTIGNFAAVTVAPLAAVEMTGAATFSGLPTAATLAGAAGGAALMSRVMASRGRRPGLVLGFGLGATGAGIAVGAVAVGSFGLFIAGMLVMGCGNGANLLARYAVADVHPAARRTTVLGWVVWAGTIGAVVGPSLVDPVGRALATSPLPLLAGGPLVGTVAMALSAVLCAALLRPDPMAVAVVDDAPVTPPGVGAGAPIVAPVSAWRSPVVIVALSAMVAGQFVMVLIMTMTPVHANTGGAGLGAVGFIMSAHTFGMFALTPVAGVLADRLGNTVVIAIGLALVVAAGVLGALTPAAAVGVLSVALFLLGLGWSFGFVSASGLLARGVASAERARMQGAVDTAVFASAAIGSVSSGLLIATAGYAVLCLIGAALIVLPAVVLVRLRPAVAQALRPAGVRADAVGGP